MNKILSKTYFSEKVVKLEVEAPLIAKARKPGNFVIVRVGEKGERMPLTIADANLERGSITLVVQVMGVSSRKLCALEVGDYITDLVGPLGKPTHIEKVGTVLACGGGVGVAPLLPIVRAFKEAGNRVVSVIAGRNKDLVILEDEIRASSDEVIIMTDDGSYGKKGLITEGMEEVIKREKVDLAVTIGPAIMMKFCEKLTRKYDIPTVASLNALMVDGTGMCGACRVTVGGKTRFTCVDGPEFDAHLIDFDEILSRLGGFKDTEVAKLHDVEVKQEDAEHSHGVSDRNEPWRQELRQKVAGKERTSIERVHMPETAPEERIKSQRIEVNQGLTADMAMREATRCMDCVTPTCMEGCPVGIDIPGFVKNIERGEFLQAAAVLKRTSALPAVCGRVCPQEKQCESKCFYLQKLKKPSVAIGYLERFASDFERESGHITVPEVAHANGIKVAVIGSGPSGLSCAGDLAKLGYDVTVFEALHEIGGVLKYGIPEFRLPNSVVDVEIDNLKKIGVKFVTNFIVGMTDSVEDLKAEGFKAFYVASGAGLPRFMNIPGENYNGILSSNEYLTRVNLMGADSEDSDTPVYRGKNVVVVGGGNTAMDSVRTAKRLGAERAMIVYRRSEEEMPARLEEVKHAKEEGCEFITLTNPVEYIADERGRVKQVRVQKMALGEPDASGRRSPVPVEGSEYTIDADVVVVAVGVSPNPIVPNSVKGLEISRKGTIVVNDETMQSNLSEFFAGGDIVRGGATVILAMGDGRRAAKHIDEMFKAN
ncbi:MULTISPECIES: bifunctional dihydroorotate dehydrogenase B NAD binding subunit/NADPH-dependent glutamate synthase [Butyricimonas]|jgi:glutamate synthase (NADPH/NADH) small chain|uniref:Bifunctional dihydroorotate dehydrogenase B NAD binding subunit/NADPH-dependent glutamate synthase n=2 Tax=Butyricimonas TaxID=574697 RepID=A0A412WXU2_9BACT|nr:MULTISPECIES: bifunctional dihydroorotate dehydrogenase B NAD binding subunit/NADPH-dependent glutamate synthase [Butyricimonas]MBS5625081.1 bifunctional dihydroorotate dehydrogenase B NAD binding subunit/NADPH-dependent glutamate synthase [Porphyromonadaceae bacterium]MCI7165070.1 bifunctional dihydroorotate dehydrogenase B NAD binding subunit/NADPH-dependent glutamate synthase [Butyricimonas virosa]MDY5533325.1 bifunctional dihydroorotate dehydrogenase B NAD binding subunit/NADPH-dependent 